MEMINKSYRAITGNLGFLDRVAFEESFSFPMTVQFSLLMGKNASGECKLRHTNAYDLPDALKIPLLLYDTNFLF